MKKTIASLFVLLCCVGTANAADVLIPEDMELNDMPKDARAIVKESFSIHEGENSFYNGYFIDRESDGALKFQKGDVCKLGRLKPWSGIASQYVICERGSVSIRLKKKVYTAGAFHTESGGVFELVSIETYEGMDNSIVSDLLLAKITTAVKANNYEEALPHFARLEKMGTPLPESFYYYYIQALAKSNQKLAAKTRATGYLTKYGKKGRYYAETIALLAEL